MISAGQSTDDFGASIVDLAQRCNLCGYFRFDFLGIPEVAALEDGGLCLIRFEEVADFFRDLIWFSVFMTEEHIESNVLQIRIDMKGKMTIFEEGDEDVMILIKLLYIELDNLVPTLLQGIFEVFLDEFYICEFIVFAVE